MLTFFPTRGRKGGHCERTHLGQKGIQRGVPLQRMEARTGFWVSKEGLEGAPFAGEIKRTEEGRMARFFQTWSGNTSAGRRE